MFLLNWLILAILAIQVNALPSRGHHPFTIALCNYPDDKTINIQSEDVRRFFSSADNFGMYEYFQEQSHGAVDFQGTNVIGWFTTPTPWASIKSFNREVRLEACRNAAAKAGFVVPSVCQYPSRTSPYLSKFRHINL
jgi:hypothetical protein